MLTLYRCDNFSTRSLYLCNNSSSCAGSSVKGMCVFITLGTKNGLDCPSTTSLPVLSWHDSHSSHISATARLKTELSYRNNCAKNSFNRSRVGAIVNPPPLLLSTTLDNGVVNRKTVCLLSSSVTIIFSAILYHSHCGLSSLIEYHFFSDPGPRNDHCPAPTLFASRETSCAFDSHSFMLSLDLHEMSLNIDVKIIRPVKCSGVSLNLNSNSWTSWLSCNVLNPGKIFHSKSISSPSSLSKVLYSWWTFEPLQSLFPCSVRLGVLVYLTKKQYRIWKYVDFWALKTDDFFITNQRQCCDNVSFRSPYLCNRNSLFARSSLFKGTFVLITLGTNEELDCPPTTGLPFYRDRIHILLSFLRLPRKDWADLQK